MSAKTNHQKTVFKLQHNGIVCLLLVTAILVSYWQVTGYDFVNFDDDAYIIDNAHVRSGLTPESIQWALTTNHAGNWHPLTWLSHMLDVRLFGMDPGLHHLTSLVFHIVNSLLLFLVLQRMTGAFWRSFLVAALFALHPLNVESVAWVSERKNVLSTLFWILTMGSYALYVERPSVYRYLLVFLLLYLGLAAKPMLVTLPFVLILLDCWPFNRFQFAKIGNLWDKQQKWMAFRLLREKIPLFVLAAGSCVMTLLAEHQGGTVSSLDAIPAKIRVANALVSYVAYIGKMLWPAHLVVLYPHSGRLPVWHVTGAGLILLVLSLLAIRLARRVPYCIVGWFWYVGTLVPVIGVVQVGSQSMADRYAYVPLIGLFIMISWGLHDIVIKRGINKITVGAAVFALCSILAAITWMQVRYWANSITLFEHTLEFTDNNYTIHYNLGKVLKGAGRMDEAVKHYYEALRINPHGAETYYNLGNILSKQGRLDEAIRHYSQALKIDPDDAQVSNNLGVALAEAGRSNEAIYYYSNALRLNPDYVEAYMNLGAEMQSQGRIDEAVNCYQKALSLKPEFPEAIYHLAKLHISRGEYEKALTLYQKMIAFLPDNPAGYYNIACIYARQNRSGESVAWLQKAVARGLTDWEHIKNDKDLDNIRSSLPYKEFIKGH